MLKHLEAQRGGVQAIALSNSSTPRGARHVLTATEARSSDATLALLAPLFEAHELGSGFGQCKWADARILGQLVHGGINRRYGHRGARAAVHLFIEVPKDDAGSWQQPGPGTHDLGNGKLDIPV